MTTKVININEYGDQIEITDEVVKFYRDWEAGLDLDPVLTITKSEFDSMMAKYKELTNE